MYSQTLFAMVDKEHSTTFLNKDFTLKLPMLKPLTLNVHRVCFRTAYVVATTVIAMAFPYFNQVLGVLGAISFWPMAIYFPVEMCLRRKRIGAWTSNWILFRAFSALCFAINTLALIASIQGLVSARFTSQLETE